MVGTLCFQKRGHGLDYTLHSAAKIKKEREKKIKRSTMRWSESRAIAPCKVCMGGCVHTLGRIW